MIVLGLTGSIGMGKSTAARMLEGMGVPVCDSDAVVHRLLGRGGAAVRAIAAAFPGAVRDGAVDRRALGAAVFGDPAALKRLERILHPRVRAAQERFLAAAARRGVAVAALDVPLLFETGGDRRVDRTVVVTAPAAVQRARVLARPGMTPETFAAILSRQTPDAEKRRRADYVVPTGAGKRRTRAALADMLADVKGRRGRHWPPRGYQPGMRTHA
ncbi:dephospho-CoA kinase [Azospirillum sp. ST 5-10]|uniref:dephospho-CoA kinase n=1 Tax=unclassified Azospirillum TaxID=2630922 RepID=UPI003F4A384E